MRLKHNQGKMKLKIKMLKIHSLSVTGNICHNLIFFFNVPLKYFPKGI